MKDCENCNNHKICELETKDKIINCPFVHPIQPKEYSKGYSDGYAKAIDEFADKLINQSIYADIGKGVTTRMEWVSTISEIKELAEQMKEGVE